MLLSIKKYLNFIERQMNMKFPKKFRKIKKKNSKLIFSFNNSKCFCINQSQFSFNSFWREKLNTKKIFKKILKGILI